MPYIIADATHTDKSIQTISITAKVDFKKEAFNNDVYVHNKMLELQDKLTDLLMEYFEYTESEILSNHEYNKLNN